MIDKTIQIKKGNQIICTFGSKYTLGYDNVIWWQLSLLVNIVEKGFKSVKDLIRKVEKNTHFIAMENDGEAELTLDLDNSTIDMPYFPLYSPEQVCNEMCCIDLKKIGDDYYSVYEDGGEYLMAKVTFDDVDLLRKKNVTLDEFLKVEQFVDGLIDKYDDTDFVLNNDLIIRFNFA